MGAKIYPFPTIAILKNRYYDGICHVFVLTDKYINTCLSLFQGILLRRVLDQNTRFMVGAAKWKSLILPGIKNPIK